MEDKPKHQTSFEGRKIHLDNSKQFAESINYNHYHFLDDHFDTILTHMGREDMIRFRGNFSASGDKYYSYRDRWEEAGIPWFHGAAMYHLMELLYGNEVRDTRQGWVDPWKWVIDNYKSGHNLSQYMEGLF